MSVVHSSLMGPSPPTTRRPCDCERSISTRHNFPSLLYKESAIQRNINSKSGFDPVGDNVQRFLQRERRIVFCEPRFEAYAPDDRFRGGPAGEFGAETRGPLPLGQLQTGIFLVEEAVVQIARRRGTPQGAH